MPYRKSRSRQLVCRYCNKTTTNYNHHNQYECERIEQSCATCGVRSTRNDHKHCGNTGCGVVGSPQFIATHRMSCPYTVSYCYKCGAYTRSAHHCDALVHCKFCAWTGRTSTIANHECVINCAKCDCLIDAQNVDSHTCDMMILIDKLRDDLTTLCDKYKRLKTENHAIKRALAAQCVAVQCVTNDVDSDSDCSD